MCWTDTRDMIADGATKGAVGRQLLHECMAGTCHIRHDIKLWQPKGKLRAVSCLKGGLIEEMEDQNSMILEQSGTVASLQIQLEELTIKNQHLEGKNR